MAAQLDLDLVVPRGQDQRLAQRGDPSGQAIDANGGAGRIGHQLQSRDRDGHLANRGLGLLPICGHRLIDAV